LRGEHSLSWFSVMEREISPPPTKRQRKAKGDKFEQSGQPGTIVRPDMRYIRIFSWNINGVQSFLPPSPAPRLITSFFKPLPRQAKRAMGPTSSSQSKGPALDGPPPVGSPLREFLARHGWPEVLFLQELKINPRDHKTMAALLSALNTSLDSSDLVTATSRYTLDVNVPRDKFNARAFGGKLYGVGTILREDFASQYVATVRHAEWDLEGRVSITELQRAVGSGIGSKRQTGSGEKTSTAAISRPLALINVYAVNGTSAPYRSSENGQTVGTRHEHKIAFHSKLRDECLELEQRGFHVVVAGDLNVARGPLDGHPSLRTWPGQHCINRADFNSKFFCKDENEQDGAYIDHNSINSGESSNFQGVDVFRALRGKERRYTYHPRGEKDWG
jgi:exonuclease III